ncbi:MAG: ATP-binding protein, partial [Haloarculaceae archaeon]
MDDGELEVVEFVLTAAVYTDDGELEPDDLPADYRRVFWSDGRIERPLSATDEAAREATGVDRPWETVSGLMFTDYDDFSGTISFTDREMAEEWYRERVDDDRLRGNPVLAAHFADEFGEDVYEQAREQNRPARADRPFIDDLLAEYFQDEEEEEMLDLVDVRAPEEIEMTLDDIVL